MKISEYFREDELVQEPVGYWIEEFHEKSLEEALEEAGLDTKLSRIAHSDYVKDFKVLEELYHQGSLISEIGNYKIMELQSGEKFLFNYHEGGAYEVVFQP